MDGDFLAGVFVVDAFFEVVFAAEDVAAEVFFTDAFLAGAFLVVFFAVLPAVWVRAALLAPRPVFFAFVLAVPEFDLDWLDLRVAIEPQLPVCCLETAPIRSIRVPN